MRRYGLFLFAACCRGPAPVKGKAHRPLPDSSAHFARIFLKSSNTSGFLARVAQQRGGVQGGRDGRAVSLKPDAVLLRDAKVGLDETHGGNAPEADNDFRGDELNLALEVAYAGGLLLGQRVAVAPAAGI